MYLFEPFSSARTSSLIGDPTGWEANAWSFTRPCLIFSECLEENSDKMYSRWSGRTLCQDVGIVPGVLSKIYTTFNFTKTPGRRLAFLFARAGSQKYAAPLRFPRTVRRHCARGVTNRKGAAEAALFPVLVTPRGIEPRFLEWKPSVLAVRRWGHVEIFDFTLGAIALGTRKVFPPNVAKIIPKFWKNARVSPYGKDRKRRTI